MAGDAGPNARPSCKESVAKDIPVPMLVPIRKFMRRRQRRDDFVRQIVRATPLDAERIVEIVEQGAIYDLVKARIAHQERTTLPTPAKPRVRGLQVAILVGCFVAMLAVGTAMFT